MKQYIDKVKLVAKIKELLRANELYLSEPKTDEVRFQKIGAYSVLNDLLYFLNTLEVKEVDLEKEIQQHINDCLDIKFPTTDIKMIAKDVEYTARKFFELGLKAQK